MTTLLEAALSGGTDKVSHGYIPVYKEILSKEVSNPNFKMLEMGLGPRCASLRMWERYLPLATIIGVDHIQDCVQEAGRCQVLILDLNLDSSLKIIESMGPYNFIVEDASHHVTQQKMLFSRLFLSALVPGGTYALEDLGTSYFPGFGSKYKDSESCIEFLKDKIDGVNAPFFRSDSLWEASKAYFPVLDSTPTTALEKQIYSLSFYRSLCIVKKR